MTNCQQCVHVHICEIYRSIVLDTGAFKLAAKDTDSYALFMSSLRQALAENCKYWKERE